MTSNFVSLPYYYPSSYGKYPFAIEALLTQVETCKHGCLSHEFKFLPDTIKRNLFFMFGKLRMTCFKANNSNLAAAILLIFSCAL